MKLAFRRFSKYVQVCSVNISDNGTGYLSRKFAEYLRLVGITRILASPPLGLREEDFECSTHSSGAVNCLKGAERA